MSLSKSDIARELGSPLFQVSQLQVSEAAQSELSPSELAEAVNKHVHGIWEGVTPADVRRNERAIASHRGLIFSIVPSVRTSCYVVTSASDELTQVMLVSEFG